MSDAKKLPQILAAICICIGAMGTGTIIGWTSNITDDLKGGKLNDLNFNDDYKLGLVGSMMTTGALLICLPIGPIADFIGRKPTILLTVVPYTIGWLMITFAKHEAMVYVGRILTGIGGGGFCVIAPMYTTEIAQPELRGMLGAFFQFFLTIGILYSNLFGHVCGMLVFNIMCAAIPIVFGILFLFQPETPYYLIKCNKMEKAEEIFQRLRGKDYDCSEEMENMKKQAAEKFTFEMFKKCMKTKQAKKANLICFSLMFYQQLSGINAVMFYSKDIFKDAGSTLPDYWCVIIIGIVQVIFTGLASAVVDRLGRKILLVVSSGLMTFSLVFLGIYFLLKNHALVTESTLKNIGLIPVTSLTLFIIGFSFGMGPIPWLASSEIFPVEVKAHCSSAAAVFNWFLACMVSLFYPKLSTAIGNDITFFIFSAITATCIPFVIFVMPETKGKTLLQIQTEMGVGGDGSE